MSANKQAGFLSKLLAEAYVGLIVCVCALVPIALVVLLVKVIVWAVAG